MKRNLVAQFVIFSRSLVDWVLALKTTDNAEINHAKKLENPPKRVPDCPYRTKRHFI